MEYPTCHLYFLGKHTCFKVELVCIYKLFQTLQSPEQTGKVWRPNSIKQCLVTKHFTVRTPCLVLFDRVWSCLIKFVGHQTFKQQPKTFLSYSCLMGDLCSHTPLFLNKGVCNLFFVWTVVYQTCLKRAFVPRLLSGLYQLFDLCLIKHVFIVWPLTSTLACLVTK